MGRTDNRFTISLSKDDDDIREILLAKKAVGDASKFVRSAIREKASRDGLLEEEDVTQTPYVIELSDVDVERISQKLGKIIEDSNLITTTSSAVTSPPKVSKPNVEVKSESKGWGALQNLRNNMKE